MNIIKDSKPVLLVIAARQYLSLSNVEPITTKEYPDGDHLFIYADNLLDCKFKLKQKLVNYNSYSLCFVIEAGAVTNNNNNYRFIVPYASKDIPIDITEFFNVISYIFQEKPVVVLGASCYGFYLHQYINLLPKKSKLITLSDYVSGTSLFKPPDSLVDYILYSDTFVNINELLINYVTKATRRFFVPVIFISCNNLDYLVIDSPMNYINFNICPLYEIYLLIKQQPTSVIIRKINSYFTLLNGLTHEILIKKITDYFDTNPMQFTRYKHTRDICKELNLVYRRGGNTYEIDTYFKTLYIENRYKMDFFFNMQASITDIKLKTLDALSNYLKLNNNNI